MRYETLYIMLLIFASGLFLAGALLDTPDNIARGPDPHRDDGGPPSSLTMSGWPAWGQP